MAGSEPLCRHGFETNGERCLDPPFDHAPFPVDEFQFDQAGQELDVIAPLGRAESGLLVVFPQDGRQLQPLQLMVQQDLRRLGHARRTVVRHM